MIDQVAGTISHPVEGQGPSLAVQPFLFVVMNADDPEAPSSRHALADVDEVQFRRGITREAIRVQHQGKRQLVLTFTDAWMSGMHARLRRRGDEWFVEDAGSKNGTVIDGRRVETAHLSGDAVLEFGHTFLLFRTRLCAPLDGAPDYMESASASVDRLSTISPELGRTFSILSDLAMSSIPVLVRGETGTGKEVVAQELHRMSARRGALVAVNCGGLPPTLVEAELFGFRKGSFSGAVEDRTGLVRAANMGTLLLDEIGDLPIEAQPALLRVLQESSVVSIGSAASVFVDFRLVSATHQNLEEMVDTRSFRDDLFARLNGYTVRLPPLRERREDLGILVRRLIRPRQGQPAPCFSLESVRAILAHPWRQNVRELGRRLSVGTLLAKGDKVQIDHLFCPEPGARSHGDSAPPPPLSEQRRRTRSAELSSEELARRDRLIALLREHGGNVTAVSRAMGKARAQVQRWIRRYGLQRDEASAG